MAFGSEWIAQAYVAWNEEVEIEQFLGHMMVLYRGHLSEQEARDLQQVFWLWLLRPEWMDGGCD